MDAFVKRFKRLTLKQQSGYGRIPKHGKVEFETSLGVDMGATG